MDLGTIRHNRLNRTNKSPQNKSEQLAPGLGAADGFGETGKSQNNLEAFRVGRGFESWVWWCMPVIPALGRLRQEHLEFKASLSYLVRSYLKKIK
jgi:hypothetical protein